MKILFTGGGTGGHIFPIIAVAREIKKRQPANLELSYMGPEDEFASKLFFKEGIKTYFVLSGKVRRYFTVSAFFQNILDLFIKIPVGIVQAFLILFFTAPDMVFSKGGYGAIPTVIAAWILRIPIFMHESDSTPGLTNKIISKLSTKIFVSFPVKLTQYFPEKKMILAGNPIREELLQVNPENAKAVFNLSSDKPVILVLGGSQGSTRINDLISQILPSLLKQFEVIHQSGQKDFERLKGEVRNFISPNEQSGYHLFAFLDENQMKHALAIAACVIGRAGAGTIFEIAAFKKPSILIPLPEAAQNHQVKNAYAYCEAGATMVIEESNLTPNFFFEKVVGLLSSSKLDAMRKAAGEFAKIGAADTIADYLIKYLK
jgi:UDP-N-acetylglucosamine--N-acetylmuramyl-(pentapeptide) pyrophosphoryl-undecaprenol N-acetylglucosamine transferase